MLRADGKLTSTVVSILPSISNFDCLKRFNGLQRKRKEMPTNTAYAGIWHLKKGQEKKKS